MKRNIPSFTVEVRRQPRRASNPSANGRLFETAPIRTAFDRDTQRAADAVFEAKAPEQPLPDSAPSAPKGRILPSLVVDDASMRSFREDPEQLDEFARGPPKRRSARFQKTAKPSKPRRISASPTAETAPLAPPAEAIVVPPSEPPAASREAAGSAGAPRRTKRRSGGSRSRRSPNTIESRLGSPSRNPRSSRTVRRQRLPPSAKFRRILASEPSWAATSMATNSSPASAGSGCCARRADAAREHFPIHIVIASAAKQPRGRVTQPLGCFVASLLAMTIQLDRRSCYHPPFDMSAISARA